jgi:outer membrane receptor protein involved in Fe transport
MHTVEAVWSGKWKERLETSMSVYHNWVDDLIVRRFYGDIRMSDPFVDANGDNAVFVEWNDNFGRLRSYGADLQANAVVNRSLKAYLNYSLMGGVNTDPNTGVEYNLFKTSAHKVSTGFTWTLFDRLSISPRLRWVSDIATRQENALYAGARMPGYHLVDLQVRLLRTAPGLDLHMAVNNLLNETYYTSGVGSESGVYMPRVPQQKRSMLIGMTYHLGK